MILFRKWIEREVGLTNIPVLLPNLGGSLIEGCKIVELSDLPHTKVDKDSYNIKIQTIINENKKNTVPYDVCEKMKTFSQISKTITEESEKILKLIPENANMPQNKINEFDMRQKKLMDQSEKNKVLNIISSSAQNILLSIMENVSYSDDSQKSVWLKIRKLYEAINEMSIFYEKNFQKVLKVMNVPPKIKSDVL
jgi:hypothetical protein